MKNPAVSVVVTAHNYGRFLDQCLRSVLDQTFQDFELIVVNDGSTDNTEEVLAAYTGEPRLEVVSLRGVGLAAASNQGIRRSRGRYVMRLDADDFLDPHSLMIQSEVLDRQPEIGLVYPDYYTVDEKGLFLGYVRVPRAQEGVPLLDAIPLAGGALYRRSCYDAIGGYKEALRYQEDYDFWIRFTERFRAYGVGLPLLSYRQHAGSMSKNRASRSAARRHVKRQYAATRHLESGSETLVVIPETWPGAPGRSGLLLHRMLGPTTPMRLALDQAQACKGSKGVLVITDNAETSWMAENMGIEAMAMPVVSSTGCDRADVAWLRGFVQSLTARRRSVPEFLILSSPYCPFRHPGRLREALDTLLIHDCDLVLSMDGESMTPSTVGQAGLPILLRRTGTLAESGVLREAGEFLAVKTRWLNEARPLADSLVGYVELLYPEGWCLTDEASWQACPGLAAAAETLNTPVSAYLRAEE